MAIVEETVFKGEKAGATWRQRGGKKRGTPGGRTGITGEDTEVKESEVRREGRYETERMLITSGNHLRSRVSVDIWAFLQPPNTCSQILSNERTTAGGGLCFQIKNIICSCLLLMQRFKVTESFQYLSLLAG